MRNGRPAFAEALRSVVPPRRVVLMLLLAAGAARGQAPDMGIPELQQLDPTLTGSGVSVIQAEAIFQGNNQWEVDPGSIDMPASDFTYISSSGTATTFPNDLGNASDHAHYVAGNFYAPGNIADGVSHIYNYEADYIVNDVILPSASPLPAEIVNQSFNAVLTGGTAQQASIDQGYDNYADSYGTLFITGAGDGGLTGSPASAYNGIAVGAYEGDSSSGNYDGRSKPDIVAYTQFPGDETSYTSPIVAGAAAILLQAAQRGDAGASAQVESDASDARVLKALLLNGATKPEGWKSTVADPVTTPLDPVTGAGIVNFYNSYLNLAAGEHPFSASLAGPVSPLDSGAIEPNEGWDLDTLTNSFSGSGYLDESNHYVFDLAAATAPAFTLTATLIWWRELNQTNINNLYLYLFDTDTDQTIAASLSTIDNVQELYVQNLAPGDYDLAVVKSGSDMVSTSDTYALAFDFGPVPEPSAAWLLVPGLGFLLAGGKKWSRRRPAGGGSF